MKRECLHGLTGKRLINGEACPHRHPPRCFRWCKHGKHKKLGCTRGKECNFFHPRLCQGSVLKRVCLDENCTLVHLKKTRRSDNAADNKDPWKKKGPRVRMVSESEREMTKGFSLNSLSTASCMDSPAKIYQPTIQKNEPSKRSKSSYKEKADDHDQNSFLEMYLENIKEGFQTQIAVLRTELLTTLPQLVREQMNRQVPVQPQHPMTMQRQQYPFQQYPPRSQSQIPAQAPTSQPQFPVFYC